MLQSVLFIIVMAWLSIVLLVYFFQSKLVFHPDNILVQTPESIQLEYENVFITAKDNITINGWWVPHPKPRATLLFLHGNAGNISHRLDSIRLFHQLGLSIFIIDYRGYGDSEGQITEQGSYLDAEAAWHYLKNKKNIDAEEIIIFGRSLGGAVASWLANQVTPAGLILESTFTSIIDVGKKHYPYLPIKYMANIKYDSLSNIEKINVPVLFIHSPADEIVPYALGRMLYEKANQPKRFLEISGTHNYVFLDSGQLYTDGLNEFINAVSQE